MLSTKSKIVFSILSRQLSKFLRKNNYLYVDTSVQRGGIPGFPGCLKYTGVVTQILREARKVRGDPVALWLDLANAYGSIPHKLVKEALTRHHVPGKISRLILGYHFITPLL